MFNFKKQKKDASKPISWRERLKNGLRKTRDNLTKNLMTLLKGKKEIDEALSEELEAQLLLADVGIETTQIILQRLTDTAKHSQLKDEAALLSHLKHELLSLLQPCEQELVINQKPFVLLIVGVNGVGKTTTIAKIAHFYQKQKLKVMLAAGDTFRAAAIEQLQIWGQRNDVPVIAQHRNADSASVIFDSIQAAKTRQIDLLIADTAGRLHTQEHLMNELKKINRVVKKCISDAPHEILLVIDASMGQNALIQAKEFNDAISLSGIVLTKFDGTAKGGIIFSIAEELKIPIRFIGVGERIDDLRPFCAAEFIDALFQTPHEPNHLPDNVK